MLRLDWIDGIFAVIVILLIIGIHKFANWYIANTYKNGKRKDRDDLMPNR